MSRLPERPRLKESIDLFRGSDGRLYLYRGGDCDFAVEDPDGRVRPLLERLDGTRSLAELGACSAGYDPATTGGVVAAVEQLAELGLVEDAATDEDLPEGERERYDRQLRYFGDLAPPGVARADYQLRLRAGRVVVLGLGGLGGWSALALAAAGIGTLVGVDGDVVELSNLNRQVLFGESDVGRPKAQAAAERLRGLNSQLCFEAEGCWLRGPAQIERIVSGADVVVDAVDTPVHEIERWVNEACFAARVPYIAMSQFPPLVRIGPMFVPGETGCYLCQELDWRERYPLFDELADQRRRHPSAAPSFGPACALIGGSVAVQVAHHITGVAAAGTVGTSVTLDIRTLEATRDRVVRRPDCPICAERRAGVAAETAQTARHT